ncbi:unnamed protein product [Phaedon cochleariae]|uniref:RING-type E3 ubiquitin transferase n=1 Tax=Phaedon cochleariae TaxID=80249 RepID=A0A9P0DZ13_PHACE|nr:unnamed protein product [Phaedon cochleariae]
MAPKRQKITKNSKFPKVKNYETLILSDVLCPICRSIMTDPVSLPCNHNFCLCCFEDTMKNVNLVCPLCKVRVGSWWRKTKKEGNHVNVELWRVIKDRFSQQVINKLTGIEEDLQEKPQIVVAYPGEIRKEYELQKKKDDEELQKRRESEVKASEQLIKSLKDEEDYQRVVREEKLKLDEEIAKKLAAEMSFSSPSTSQMKMNFKKLGPMDRFVKKEIEPVKLQVTDQKQHFNNNFATKEYTCRVLRLDKNDRQNSMKMSSPIIRRKIQQIKKIVESETHSDSSDCIESEMRYFKPIDHRMNPPSQGKPPIKIFPKKPHKTPAPEILSPRGSINLVFSNFLKSAFVRTVPKSTSPPLRSHAEDEHTCSLKRPRSDGDVDPNQDKKLKRSDATNKVEQSSIITNSFSNTPKRQVFGKNISRNIKNDSSSSSPLFYGFENSPAKNNEKMAKKNGKLATESDDLERKLLQEKLDLEFAKRLQEDFDRTEDTRGARRATRNAKRQATLEEIVKRPHRVK